MRNDSQALRRGFALVLTMALLSFLLLLVATLATSLRIETQSSLNQTHWNQARNHALVGMNIALGQLQELAGPDQRVTATAGILSDKYDLPAGNEHWTGVWNSANGNFEGWLVSDSIESELEGMVNQTTPAPLSDNDSVWMVNHSIMADVPEDASGRIAIRKQPIVSIGVPGFSATDKITTGNFAYWVSDEGTKASALKQEVSIPGNPNELEESRINQLANRNTDLHNVFGRIDLNDQETKDRLERIFSFRQLEALDGISKEGLAEQFHQLTPVSRGVLANTLEGSSGGLRLDLSQTDRVSPNAIPINNAAINFIQNRPNTEDRLEIRGSNGGASEPQFSVSPITTEFALRIGFSRPESGDGDLKLHLALRADLWNPYSLPLQNTPRDEADLIVRIDGLPNLDVRYVTTDGGLFITRDAFSVDMSPIEYREFLVDFFSELAPGEVRNIYQSFVEASVHNYVDATPSEDNDDAVIIESNNTVIDISVLTLSGELVQEFTNIPFQILQTEAVPIPRIDYDSDDPPNLLDSQMPLRYWFRFNDEPEVVNEDGLSDIERWSNKVDPRNTTFDFNNTQVLSMIDFETDVYSGFSDDDFIGRPEFFYGGGRGRRSRNYHRFFDLPTVEPLSVAALRHLNLPSSGPSYLGSPDANTENRIFDECYFSTLPNNLNEAQLLIDDDTRFFQRPFLNPHINLIEDHSAEDLSSPINMARNSFQFGAFNINCTQAETWKLVLGGNSQEDWNFRINYPGVNQKTRDLLENPFYRLPFGADRHYKYPSDEHSNYPTSYNKNWFKTEWTPDWGTSYTVGIREFTEDDLTELAERIVEVITEQQTPSRSVADFLNKGILQQAIDRTDINTINGTEYRTASRENRIPLNAPAFLNQADILNTIAPFIQARSDTFRIRAYGDAINPVTGKLEGRAWCEAWVQRFPDLFDESGDVSASATGFGRKFKILNFKWLDESQI